MTCPHVLDNRNYDLATADEFCGDCGVVTELYTPGRYGMLPGNEAAKVIATWLGKQPNATAGSITIHSVWHAGGDLFDISAKVYSPNMEWMIFQLRRNPDLSVEVISARH